ncbi:MAG: lipopolysaccharide biosynthesis protein [Gammaproteobacteria bacterium]
MQNSIKSQLARLTGFLYPDGGFRTIATLSGGSVVGHLIAVGASPFIARLYDPKEFGLFSIFFSIFGILSIVSTLQLNNAVPLPTRDRDGARLLLASLAIVGTVSVLLMVLISLFGSSVLSIAGVDSLGTLLWFLPATIGIANTNLAMQFWFLRKKEYVDLAIVKALQSTARAGGQIGMGLAGLGPVGLAIGVFFGQFVSVLFLYRGVIKRHRSAFVDLSAQSIYQKAMEHRSFATTYTPSALLEAGTVYMPAIVLGVLFGPAVAGLYAFTLQAARGGMSIVVEAISKVFLVQAVDDYNAARVHDVRKRALRLCLAQFALGVPIFGLIVAYGESIFGLVFGENWSQGGYYAALLTPHLFSLFIFEHLTRLFVVTGRHLVKLVWEILRFAVLLLTVVAVKVWSLDAASAVLMLSCGWCVLHVALVPMTFPLLSKRSLNSEPDQ